MDTIQDFYGPSCNIFLESDIPDEALSIIYISFCFQNVMILAPICSYGL